MAGRSLVTLADDGLTTPDGVGVRCPVGGPGDPRARSRTDDSAGGSGPSAQPAQPPAGDEGGGGWLNTELSAVAHWVCSEGMSSASGTRLASDNVADSASHWMSW